MKDYLRLSKLGSREMFVPLVHPAGEAQADFGEAVVAIGGVECKAHYLAMDLPHSDDCFVVAFPAETTEAFLPPQQAKTACRGPGRRTREGVRVLWRRTDQDSLRQHEVLGDQEPRQLRFPRHADAQQGHGAGAGAIGVSKPQRKFARSWK